MAKPLDNRDRVWLKNFREWERRHDRVYIFIIALFLGVPAMASLAYYIDMNTILAALAKH
jgi:hypothetical protein